MGKYWSPCQRWEKRLHQFKIWCKSPFKFLPRSRFLDILIETNWRIVTIPKSQLVIEFHYLTLLVLWESNQFFLLSSFSSNRPTRRLSVSPFQIFSFLQLSALKMKKQMDWLQVLRDLRFLIHREIYLDEAHWLI